MKFLNKYLIIASVILIGLAVFFSTRDRGGPEVSDHQNTVPNQLPQDEPATVNPDLSVATTRIEHFSEINPVFRFSAPVPDNWQINYVSSLQAIDLSNQIFIRFFEGSDFLTLSTVNILRRENDTIGGHQAVRYEIEKKPEVANFTNQPLWRSQKHEVTDIRLSAQNPTFFYVFAKNPELDDAVFEEFLQSMSFHNDQSSYSQPLTRAIERIAKKPFGLYITPATSPVQPDRFTGFHTGADYEVFADEHSVEVPVTAICGGELRQKTTAGGYGGLAVQECLLNNQMLSAVYGHLDRGSITASVGQYLSPGEFVGFLGDGETTETDGARKHLHLSIYRGPNLDIRGYVQNENELSSWVDPENVIK